MAPIYFSGSEGWFVEGDPSQLRRDGKEYGSAYTLGHNGTNGVRIPVREPGSHRGLRHLREHLRRGTGIVKPMPTGHGGYGLGSENPWSHLARGETVGKPMCFLGSLVFRVVAVASDPDTHKIYEFDEAGDLSMYRVRSYPVAEHAGGKLLPIDGASDQQRRLWESARHLEFEEPDVSEQTEQDREILQDLKKFYEGLPK